MENQKNKEEVVLNTSNEHTEANVSVDETAKKVHKKRENAKLLKILLFSVIGFIVLLIASFFLFRYFKGLKEFSYNEEYPLYQYFAGAKNVYTGKVTLSLDDEITKIETTEGVYDMEDAPIYFQNVDNTALTSKTMLLVFPRINNKNYRINAFSKIEYDKESNVSFYYLGKNKILLEDAFLYDGDNVYMFLCNTSVVIGEKTYELSPLSYMVVNYHDQIEVYDKASDKYEIIDFYDKDVIATYSSHKINMSVDMVNDNRLLIKTFDNLPIYENK